MNDSSATPETAPPLMLSAWLQGAAITYLSDPANHPPSPEDGATLVPWVTGFLGLAEDKLRAVATARGLLR